jgi:hypothetical protein
MTEPKVFIYSGTSTPRLIRPALPGELHYWLHADGSKSQLIEGVWAIVAAE